MTRRASSPDVAVIALPLFAKLRTALLGIVPPRTRRRWGEPAVFFFDPKLQAEWQAVRPLSSASAAENELVRVTDNALTVLGAAAEVRHAARATPGLIAAAAAAAPHHLRAREVADVLAIPDDETIRVVHPASETTIRVGVRGIADVGQFHILFADLVANQTIRGLAGRRPDPRVIDAYRAGEADADLVAVARFQMYRPSAWRIDGTLPGGLSGSDHWLWPTTPLGAVPRENGERTILIGEPVYRATWPAVRRVPRVAGSMAILDVRSTALPDRTSTRPAVAVVPARRAA